MDVKAGEEIPIQAEWLPHREDNVGDSENVTALQKESDKKDNRIAELQTALDNEKLAHSKDLALKDNRIAELQTALDNEKLARNKDLELIRKFTLYLTARADIKFLSEEGDFEIISVSDDKAEIKKPAFLQQDGIGYQINSFTGKLEFIAKASADGQIQLNLRGMDIRKPEDQSKRIPYWIDYTKLTVNGETLFDKVTPVWHNKPYRYYMDAKAGEEIKIQLEWLPHRSDT